MAKIAALRITARHAGFRRAGIEHPATPVDHPLDGLTKTQIALLKDEPGLVVQEIEIEVEDQPKPPAATRGRGGAETKA